jgi:glucose-6-phosphate-specific signal transduction histidine kinase
VDASLAALGIEHIDLYQAHWPDPAVPAAETAGTNLSLSITDDAIGGADSRKRSGLIGLIDRVEALGGKLRISSVVGSGTSLLATIPFEGS